MAQDLTLVTAEQPTDEDVRRACATVLLHGRALDVDGSFVPDPELAGVGLSVGMLAVGPASGAPYWTLYTPRPQGSTWITDTVLPTQTDDDGIEAVLAAAAALVRRLGGHVLVDGEPIALDGTLDGGPGPLATRAPEPAPASRATPERLSLFGAARLDLGDVSGDEGWRTVLRHIGGFLNLTGDIDLRRQLAPSHLWTDAEEWVRLDPRGPAPAWWPTPQRLGRTAPRARWRVDGASGPADTFSGFAFGAALTASYGPRALADLEALVPHHLQYGLVHLWTPAEPSNPVFSGPSAQRHDPDLMLTDFALRDFVPDLYWAQVFGPPWVELFGAETIASVPAFRSEQLAEGVWVVQLTENLEDVASDHAAFVAVRERCKQHLGADSFHTAEKSTFGSYRAPVLPTLAERGLVPPAPSIEDFLGTRGG
jgi:hypothetical protein